MYVVLLLHFKFLIWYVSFKILGFWITTFDLQNLPNSPPALPKCWGILENLWIQLGDRQHLGCICATGISAETSGDRTPDFFGAFPTSVWCREDSHLLDFRQCCDCQLFLARTDPQIPSPQWESDYCVRGKAGFHFWGHAQANPKKFGYLPYRNSHISCKKKKKGPSIFFRLSYTHSAGFCLS